jgi:hypothetical protein
MKVIITYYLKVVLGGMVFSVLDIGPKVREFRPGRRILQAIKVRSMTSFRGEVQPSVPCRKIYGMLKNVKSIKDILCGQSSRQFTPCSPASLLGVSVDNCQIALASKSGMVRTQIGTHSISEMVAVHGAPRSIPPRDSNSSYKHVQVRAGPVSVAKVNYTGQIKHIVAYAIVESVLTVATCSISNTWSSRGGYLYKVNAEQQDLLSADHSFLLYVWSRYSCWHSAVLRCS